MIMNWSTFCSCTNHRVILFKFHNLNWIPWRKETRICSRPHSRMLFSNTITTPSPPASKREDFMAISLSSRGLRGQSGESIALKLRNGKQKLQLFHIFYLLLLFSPHLLENVIFILCISLFWASKMVEGERWPFQFQFSTKRTHNYRLVYIFVYTFYVILVMAVDLLLLFYKKYHITK